MKLSRLNQVLENTRLLDKLELPPHSCVPPHTTVRAQTQVIYCEGGDGELGHMTQQRHLGGAQYQRIKELVVEYTAASSEF